MYILIVILLYFNIFFAVIDSMATYPAGVLSGTTTDLGDFDQCISIDGNFQQQQIVGKYCLATVSLPKTELFKSFEANGTNLKPFWIAKIIEQWHNNDNWYSLATGLCFPSLCHQEEIRSILRACKFKFIQFKMSLLMIFGITH